MREVINFDRGWMFHKGDIKPHLDSAKAIVYYEAKTERALRGPASRNYDTSWTASEGWTAIDLPHDYVIEETPCRENNEGLGFFTYNNAWYIKKFRLTDADKKKRITLLFEGVATHATVYLNGCLMKRNYCGYNEFEVDITDVCDFEKENTLAVYVNTENHESWWYEGGGIYRHVRLTKTDRVSIDLYGIYANPKKLDGERWLVSTELTVRNDNYENKRVDALLEIKDKCGIAVASEKISGIVGALEKRVFKVDIEVDNPALWSPDSPSLYYMNAKVFHGKREVDEKRERFGFRTVVADPKTGLYINGKHYKIQGVCGHADCGLTGKAVPDNIHRYKVSLLREMGANGYRTSHYPQSRALMDALDEAGFIVMDEVRWFESTDDGLAQLEMLVKRDRNRPSVVFWSLGNEELHHVTEVGRRIAKKMLETVKRLDSSRLIMTAINITPENATVCDELDVIGVNYCWEAYAAVHEKFPDKPVISSENCATGTTRGWYYGDDPTKSFVTAYDHDSSNLYKSREYSWKFISEREWMLGGYQWIAFEHRGEAAWPRLCSQSGAIDLFLQKKDAFYQNMSHWTEKPMVHLLPHWNWQGREGEPIRVVAYTNVSRLELFLNGKSLGTREIERFGHGEWQVAYESGVLEAVAYDGEKIVARDTRVTSGAPHSLALRLDTTDAKANGEDIAIFTCYVLDKDGREVYDATPTVSFTTNSLGRVYSTGSDITDHSSLFLSTRRMRAGRISVAVKLGETSGELKLYAESSGLRTATVSVKV